jgi:hypothetical protein
MPLPGKVQSGGPATISVTAQNANFHFFSDVEVPN